MCLSLWWRVLASHPAGGPAGLTEIKDKAFANAGKVVSTAAAHAPPVTAPDVCCWRCPLQRPRQDTALYTKQRLSSLYIGPRCLAAWHVPAVCGVVPMAVPRISPSIASRCLAVPTSLGLRFGRSRAVDSGCSGPRRALAKRTLYATCLPYRKLKDPVHHTVCHIATFLATCLCMR